MPSASSPPLPDVTATAEPVIVLDDDTPSKHALKPKEDEEGALNEPAHSHSKHDLASATDVHLRLSFALAVASVSSIAVMHAPLLAVTTASYAAPLLHATVSLFTANAS